MCRAKRLSALPPDLNTELARVLRGAAEAGQDIIDLATDTLVIPSPLSSASLGIDTSSLPDAVALAFRERLGVTLDPETEILPIRSVPEALGHLFVACLDPGDTVLLPDPGHPSALRASIIAGGTPAFYMSESDPSSSALLSALDGGIVAAARAIVVSNPRMPWGTVAGHAAFQPLIDFARETGLLIVCDSREAAIAYDGGTVPSILGIEGVAELAVELRTQFVDTASGRLQVTVAAGNAGALRALASVQSNFQDNVLVDGAKSSAPHDTEDDFLNAMTSRRNEMVDGLASLGWRVRRPAAGWSVWASPPPEHASPEFVQELLTRAEVLAAPGGAFGSQGEGSMRFCFGGKGAQKRIAEALERMKQRIFCG